MKLFAVFLVALSTTFVNADEYEKIQSVLTDDQPESGKYQVRRYIGGENMACTIVRSMSDKIATIVGKRRLDRYFNGSNMEGVQMKTGNPFTVMHSKRECVGYCSKNFKICEFVENKHKDNPPKPLSHNIFFDPITPRIGYIWLFKSLGSIDWNYQMSEFAKVLGEEKLSNTYNFFYAITYYNYPLTPDKTLTGIVVIEKSAELDRVNTYYNNKNFGFFFDN